MSTAIKGQVLHKGDAESRAIPSNRTVCHLETFSIHPTLWPSNM